MFKRLVCLLLGASWLTATATAQQQEQPKPRETVVLVTKSTPFTHYECPAVDASSVGGSREHPIDDPNFGQAYFNAVDSDNPDVEDEPNKFECRWIRLRGFLNWDRSIYKGRLFESALDTYSPSEPAYYFVESFAPGGPQLTDVMRRSVTLVGRFYDLCAAADRALEAEKAVDAGSPTAIVTWTTSYPCHEVPAMMLAGVRVEKIHDGAAQYLAGDRNLAMMGSLRVASADERKTVEPVMKAWVASLRQGVKSYADDYVAKRSSWAEEDKQDARARIESADSYESYLLRQRAFTNVNLQTAQMAVFKDPDDEGAFTWAIGCVCLETTCANRWPLTAADAKMFLGPAACVELQSGPNFPWRW